MCTCCYTYGSNNPHHFHLFNCRSPYDSHYHHNWDKCGPAEMAIVCLFLFSCCLQWSGVGSVFTPVVHYSFSTTDAFLDHGRGSNVPLSGNYVDGVSITYNTPPAHIWTYAVGAVAVYISYESLGTSIWRVKDTQSSVKYFVLKHTHVGLQLKIILKEEMILNYEAIHTST